jgi:hypothetical protein
LAIHQGETNLVAWEDDLPARAIQPPSYADSQSPMETRELTTEVAGHPVYAEADLDIPAFKANEVWLPHNTNYLNALANVKLGTRN